MSGPDQWPQPDARSDTAGGPKYNPRTDTYVGSFDERPASIAVTEALASIRHCDPIELEPLYHSIDPEALDAIVDSGDSDLRATFRIDGFEITVTGHGRLEITPPSA